jgi:polyribonucleotide nucleotidyltransferase
MYAAGRIPGSFFRREGRPSESAILLSRMVDRGLRPLFPDGYRNDVQIIVTALSHGDEAALDTMAAIGASAALSISDVPFQGPIANVRIAMDEGGSLIVNPTQDQIEGSRLDLRVTSSEDAIIMVEAAASEVDEETMLQALTLAQESAQPIIELQKRMAEEIGKPKREYTAFQTPEEVDRTVREWLGDRVDRAIQETSMKEERNERLDGLKEELLAALTDEATGELRYDRGDIMEVYDDVKKTAVRQRILQHGERADGRTPTEIRPLQAEVGLLPRAHGDGLFTRGETQILSIATLGTMGEAQTLDDLGQMDEKRYLHHYNFPPYSTGETWPLRGPKRREIGHGALAETAPRPFTPP